MARSGLSTRNMLIAAISLGLGLGLWQVQQLAGAAGFGPLPADVLPQWALALFVSGIVVSGVAAAILNAVLPEELEG